MPNKQKGISDQSLFFWLLLAAMGLFPLIHFFSSLKIEVKPVDSLWKAELARQEMKLRSGECQPTDNATEDAESYKLFTGEVTYSHRQQYICEDGTVAWKQLQERQ